MRWTLRLELSAHLPGPKKYCDAANLRWSPALLPHVQGDTGLVGHTALIPGRIEHHVDRHGLDALHGRDRVLDPARHLAGHRAARSRQGHVDRHVPVVVDVDAVDQAEL